MRAAVYLMVVLVLFLLAGAIPIGTGGAERVIFRTPIFVLLLAVLCGLIVHSCFKSKFSWKRLGFYSSHLGIVLLLAGALIGGIWGRQMQFSIPVSTTKDFWELPVAEGEYVDLGFGISVTDFTVEYFEPDYALYRPVRVIKDGIPETDYEFVDRIEMYNQNFNLGKLGLVPAEDLQTENGDWEEQYLLPGGEVLVKYPQEAQHYLAVFRIRDQQDKLLYHDLEVNHPVNYQGWRFYLMSYDHESLGYVVLSARKDPGRLLVIWGIWVVLIGTGLICWKAKPRAIGRGMILDESKSYT